MGPALPPASPTGRFLLPPPGSACGHVLPPPRDGTEGCTGSALAKSYNSAPGSAGTWPGSLAAAGLSLKDARATLGHGSVRMTSRIYSHRQKSQAQQVDEATQHALGIAR